MITRALSIRIVALKLGCSIDQVVGKLQESPGLIQDLLGVPLDGQLILRDGFKRHGITGTGELLETTLRDPNRTMVPDSVALVRTLSPTPELTQLFHALKQDDTVRAEYIRLWPDNGAELTSFLNGTGCAICKSKIAAVLNSDETRKQQLLAFVKAVPS